MIFLMILQMIFYLQEIFKVTDQQSLEWDAQTYGANPYGRI